MSLPGIFAAMRFAAERHAGQLRKGMAGYPYINHVIAVSELLARCGVADAETLQAALLHDTIEDTDATPDQLATAFGTAVRDLVLEVSDDPSLPRDERKRRQIAHAAELSERARRIKIADKTCNIIDIALDPPPDWSRTRRLEYVTWAEAVVHHCLGVGPPDLERAWQEALGRARAALA